MTVSEKQLEANRQNATKGGVKTPEGKEIVKHNVKNTESQSLPWLYRQFPSAFMAI